ncbi:hypothetical protein PQX77_012292 [Marasmius sp. AFHP31]|nr:hypothetical protein PQX77_012292 [Marasmius sp. AFHP31]
MTFDHASRGFATTTTAWNSSNSPSAKLKTSGAPVFKAVSVKEELKLKLGGGVGSGGSGSGRAVGSEWSVEVNVAD